MIVRDVTAWEVLDSRGDPTVRVRVEAGGAAGTFTVPSGASTGRHEAVERRDGGDRYGGRGVRGAVRAVDGELGPAIVGHEVTAQRAIDGVLVECDGTGDLSRLGANAVLGISGAVARAASAAREEPLYAYLADGEPGPVPRPMVNLLSGGAHAPGGLAIQDLLAVPTEARTYEAAVETVWSVRQALKELIRSQGHRPLVADEGGFAPPVASVEEAFDLLSSSVRSAGYVPGEEVAFGIDMAATQFHDEGGYTFASTGRRLDRSGMIDLVTGWIESYPIVSVEDPLDEDDWRGWGELSERIGDRVQLVADDLVVTNGARLERAVAERATNAVLVKPNQAGTITRTLDVIDDVRAAGWGAIVSARSGETADTTIADLAVARHAGQIKIGSLARSERLAKYNRLLEITGAIDSGFAGTDTIGPGPEA